MYPKNTKPLFYFIFILSFLSSNLPASQSGGIDITRNEYTLDYPTSLTFHLSASSSINIVKVTLFFGTTGPSCQPSGARQSIDFTPANEIEVEWLWDISRIGSLPNGAEIWWEWEIEDANSKTLRTEKLFNRILDPRHEWKSLKKNLINLFWYEGSQSFGKAIMDIAEQNLQRASVKLAVVPKNEIWLTLYPTISEVQEALNGTYEWAAGVALTEYSAILLAIGPYDMDFARSSIPHELAHLLVDGLVFNCQGISIPTWLHEGIAMVVEGDLSYTYRNLVLQALANDSLRDLTALQQGFSPYSDEAILEYYQSAMVIEFLLKKYPDRKISQLLTKMQEGNDIDEALLAIYGVDTNGLDAVWRASLGYDFTPDIQPSATGSIPTYTLVPTIALWTSAVKPSRTASPTSTATTTCTPTPSPKPNPTLTYTPSITITEPPASPAKTPLCASIPGMVLMTLPIYYFLKVKKRIS